MSVPSKKFLFNFYYDVISPYSWIAFEALTRYESVWPVELRLQPVFLGAILQSAGNKPPMTVKPKAVYLGSDIKLSGRYWGVSFKVPENYPEWLLQNSSLNCQRFLTAVSEKHPSKLREASALFWKRFWGENKSYDKKEDLAYIAEALSLDNDFADFAFDKSVKETLKKTTDEAVKTGAFGVPWIVIQNNETGASHKFFGSDRLPLIADVCALPYNGPFPA